MINTNTLRRKMVMGSLAVACLCAVASVQFANFVEKDRLQKIESSWRYTKYGWQDSEKWYRPKPVEAERRIEHIHPCLWAAMVLLSVIGVSIWASNEWEISRLFGGWRKNGP